jgi:hypothetical protein
MSDSKLMAFVTFLFLLGIVCIYILVNFFPNVNKTRPESTPNINNRMCNESYVLEYDESGLLESVECENYENFTNKN